MTINDILPLINQGLTYKAIAEKLSIPQGTLQYYMKKFNLSTLKASAWKAERFCETCNTPLSGKQERFCGKNCNSKFIRPLLSQKSKEKRCERKQYLVDLKGGCCERCGYKTSNRALNFHHRDPEFKSFELNTRTIINKKLEKVLIEVEKCDLLCANCHAEVHDEIELNRI